MNDSCVEREISQQQVPLSTVGQTVNAFLPLEGWGWGGVLRISSDRDDRMQENVEVKKFLDIGLPTNPHKNPGPTILGLHCHAMKNKNANHSIQKD